MNVVEVKKVKCPTVIQIFSLPCIPFESLCRLAAELWKYVPTWLMKVCTLVWWRHTFSSLCQPLRQAPVVRRVKTEGRGRGRGRGKIHVDWLYFRSLTVVLRFRKVQVRRLRLQPPTLYWSSSSLLSEDEIYQESWCSSSPKQQQQWPQLCSSSFRASQKQQRIHCSSCINAQPINKDNGQVQ